LIRLATGIPYRDFGCTLRLFRRESLNGVQLHGEKHRFLTILLAHQGGRITQTPVQHHPRTAGESKYGLGRTFRVLLDLLTILQQTRFVGRPMHLIGGAGLVLALLTALGIATTAVRTLIGSSSGQFEILLLSAVCGVGSLQLFAAGLCAEWQLHNALRNQGERPYQLQPTVRNSLRLHRAG
jgi:hypothetical protein